VLPVTLAQRQTLAQRRLVDLDDLRPGPLQVHHPVAHGEGDLAAGEFRGKSSLTKDQFRMLPDLVSMPFIDRPVRPWAYCRHATVIGFRRAMSPDRMGGRTQREP